VLQRHVLYLGEINSSQELAWRKSIEVFEDGALTPRTLSLFPDGSSSKDLTPKRRESRWLSGLQGISAYHDVPM
jgi:hypothetical protein